MYPNDKKSIALAMEVEPVTATDPKCWKWEDQRWDVPLGRRPTRSLVTERSGTSQIYQSFWGKLTRKMGSGMGEMIQAQLSQHQTTATPSAQAGLREFYSDWALTELTGYAQVYTETGTSRIWENFQISKECVDNRQELLAGMMYWAKKNGIEINTAVFFVNLSIKEMVKKQLYPGCPVAVYESAESGISPLMVTPRTKQETEEEIRREEAAAEYQKTKTQAEALQTKKSDPMCPPRNWYELKEMLATFAALLWVLFGDVCPLYDQVLKLWRVLNHPYIKAVKSKFTRIRCAHITWQVLEETRLFFDQRLGPNDFTNRGTRRFPTADL